ncbi:MAG: hypothetical protein ACOYB0_10665 [Polynucleobacter sp.]
MVYEWKSGSRIKANAQKVGEELEKIECRDARSIVAAARKSKGELHSCFEWDDTKAAEEHRREQARLVLRMIVTPIDVKKGSEVVTTMVRAYESVRFASIPDDGEEEEPDKAMTYVPTREALSDPDLRQQIINRLDTTIAEAEATAETYSYLAPVLKKTAKKLHEAGGILRA